MSDSPTSAFALAIEKIESQPPTSLLKRLYYEQMDAFQQTAQIDRLTDAQRGLIAVQTLAGCGMAVAADRADFDAAASMFQMLQEAAALFALTIAAQTTNAPESADDAVLSALWARTVARDN